MAGIACGAWVSVAARAAGNTGVGAPGPRTTSVGGAWVVVIADQRCAKAAPVVAFVDHRAGIAIVTQNAVVRRHAADPGDAKVVGTWIAIFAVFLCSHARPILAGIVDGAGIAIVTSRCVVRVDTSGCQVAGIVGAGIGIFADESKLTDAGCALAVVVCGALVAIIAPDRAVSTCCRAWIGCRAYTVYIP